jgi:chaperone required for assembly of F1-ATPase
MIEDEAPAARSGGAALGRDPPPQLPKRFFAKAHVEPRDGGFALLLDGRVARTPARRALSLPSEATALALAEEWNGLGTVIDPRLMPLTRLVNAAIDGVALQMAETLAEVSRYLRSDLLVYRAGDPQALVEAQSDAWDRVLAWCRDMYGARFVLAEGVVFVAQPPATLFAMEQGLAAAVGEGPRAPFRLAALNVMTVLTGSALLALAVLRGFLSAEAGWSAAHVDETFQEQRWGADAEALARRHARWQDMRAAATLARLASA